MRTIIWIFTAIIFLIVVSFVGYNYFTAPSTDQIDSIKGLVIIGRQYVNDEEIDMSKISNDTDSPNVQVLHILGEYYARLQKDTRALKDQKNQLLILSQPRNLAASQTLDVSLQRVDDYDKKVAEMRTDLLANLDDHSAKLAAIKKVKGLVFDTVLMSEKLAQKKTRVEDEVKLYAGVSQYVRALLQFAKSRTGYVVLKNDGNLYFSNPADQDYYSKLVYGLNQFMGKIDDYNTQDINEIRKQDTDLGRAINF